MVARLAEELLSSPRVADALAQGLGAAFGAKRRLDRSMQMLLAFFNLPSHADLARVVTKLEVIQGSLVNLNLKVDRLAAGKPRRRRRRSRPPERPPPPEEPRG